MLDLPPEFYFSYKPLIPLEFLLLVIPINHLNYRKARLMLLRLALSPLIILIVILHHYLKIYLGQQMEVKLEVVHPVSYCLHLSQYYLYPYLNLFYPFCLIYHLFFFLYHHLYPNPLITYC